MHITPMVLHAAMRLPALTPLFSDPLLCSSLTITPGAAVEIVTAEPHGLATGTRIAIAITDADVPLTVSASLLPNGDVRMETSADHDLSGPPPNGEPAWDQFVRLTGFEDPLINGERQLVSVESRRVFTIRPGGIVSAIVAAPGQAMLDRLPLDVIGWHAVTAEGLSSLVFPAPDHITTPITVPNPIVVQNIRVWGAVDLDTMMRKFVRGDDDPAAAMSLKAFHMFIAPMREGKMSRSKHARTDAYAEVHPGMELRQMLRDGFNVVVFAPAEHFGGGVMASDICREDILVALLKTFHGMNIPRPAFRHGAAYAAMLTTHRTEFYNGAVYAHTYEFEVPTYLSNAEIVLPWESAAIDGSESTTPATNVPPIGTAAFRDVDFSDILHDGMPQPLTGSFNMENS